MNDSSTGGFLSPVSPLPADDDSLDAILQGLIRNICAIPGNLVRPRWQYNPPVQPEPDVDWCALGIVDEEPESNIALMHSGAGDGTSESISTDVLTVLASFYGLNARRNAHILRVGLMIPQNRETLFNTGLQLMEIPGTLVFAPAIVSNQTLRRADIFLKFRRRTTMTWAIRNVLQMQGSIVSDSGIEEPLLTPHSVSPLVE